MRRLNDLETRLVDWGREFGGGQYEDTGWQGVSPLAVLMKWHGLPPTGLNPRNAAEWTPADEVQEAVNALAGQVDGALPARIIQVEYQNPGKPFESKQQLLRREGCQVQRTAYYKHLRVAQVYVAAWLRISFSPPVEDAAPGTGVTAA